MLSSLSSLRVRLPLLFLAGIVLAGVVTGLIAIQLFRDFARNQTLNELRRESASVAQLYSSWVKADFAARRGQSRRPPTFAGAALEQATGDRIYFDGPISPFPGEDPGLPRINPTWLTPDVVALARGIYAERAFDRLPILADALQDAGCDNADVLGHCRGPGPHARGCWVVDLVLGKE